MYFLSSSSTCDQWGVGGVCVCGGPWRTRALRRKKKEPRTTHCEWRVDVTCWATTGGTAEARSVAVSTNLQEQKAQTHASLPIQQERVGVHTPFCRGQETQTPHTKLERCGPLCFQRMSSPRTHRPRACLLRCSLRNFPGKHLRQRLGHHQKKWKTPSKAAVKRSSCRGVSFSWSTECS
jgi:hypothetical protein